MRRPPSTEQIAIAGRLGLDVRADSSDVAAARIYDAVAVALGHEPLAPSTERQRDFASSLGCDVSADSQRTASAKIGELLQDRNERAIAELDLKPGDRVVRVHRFEHDGQWQTLEQEFVVSSIQPNGRIFFKGGNGQGAWPSQIRKAESK